MDVVFEKAKEYEEFPQSKRVLRKHTVYLEKIKEVPLFFNKYGKSDRPLVRSGF